MSSNSELLGLLAQLARFYGVNETRISSDQALRCLELLPVWESSALDRLFGLFLYHRKNRPISRHSPPARRDNAPSVATAASRTACVTASQARARQWSPEDHPALSPISRSDDDQQDVSVDSPRPQELDPGSQRATPCSEFDENTPPTTPATSVTLPDTGESTSLHFAVNDDTFGTITFAPSTKRLFEACKTDRGGFLRAIGEAKAAFPTGQGWLAAIATKEENADMRDRMKIYHRFECYNIYQHVVEAGFHTGTHWIRDMRTALANKLCQDFPERFQNQKTANKSLNWVDQGCRYHEWAGLLSSETTDLGYLIALPLDVPHSAYTSRCTKERMHAAALKFKSQGIDELVNSLELSESSNHIAATLKAMTSTKRKDAAGKFSSPWSASITMLMYLADLGEVIHSPRKSPRLMSGLRTLPAPLALAIQLGQNLTPPESLVASTDCNPMLDMVFSVDHQPLSHSSGADTSNPIADDCAVACDDSFDNSTYDFPQCSTLCTPMEVVDFSPTAYSGLFMSPGYTATLAAFDEMVSGFRLCGGFVAN